MQKLIYGIGAFLLLLVVIGLVLPSKHQVEVAMEIDAPPATVFALVNDFERFAEWSSWRQTDPNAQFLFSGPRRGEGAAMSWDGAMLGSGEQVITKSLPYERVDIAMNPGGDGEARSWFSLREGVAATEVTWGFETDYGMNIVGRYFASMLGGVLARDQHESLKRLKELAESLPSADFRDIEAEHLIVEPFAIAYFAGQSRPDPDAMSDALGAAYFRILRFIDSNGLSSAGAPLAITHDYDGANLRFEAAIPVTGVTEDTPLDGAGVKIGQSYGGAVVRVPHIGSYKELGATQRKIAAYLAALGIERNGPAWESYVSDPGEVAERDLLTYVYYPIREEDSQ